MNYHGVPQYVHVMNLVKEIVDGDVFVNVPSELETEITSPNVLVDSINFAGKGPISGLLTAYETVPEVSFLVVGIDYPQLSMNQLKELYTAHQVSGRSVCFSNPSSGFIEPLVAIYSAADLVKLNGYLDEGNESLRHFLGQSDTLVLPLSSEDALTSIDHPSEAEKIQSKIPMK